MNFVERAREIVGATIVWFGMKVAGYEPLRVEHERAFGGDDEPEGADPATPVTLSPAAQAMVDEARVETARRAARASAQPLPDPERFAPPAARRGTIADRIARARAGG